MGARQDEFIRPVHFLVAGLRGLSLLLISGRVRGPQSKVVSEQLHNKRRVLVGVLVQGVQFGDGVIERLQQIKTIIGLEHRSHLCLKLQRDAIIINPVEDELSIGTCFANWHARSGL